MTHIKMLVCAVALGSTFLLQGCACLAMPYLSRTRHIARDGDTLSKLAVTYYGSENKVPMLIQANPNLSPVEPLTAGTRVEIPVD